MAITAVAASKGAGEQDQQALIRAVSMAITAVAASKDVSVGIGKSSAWPSIHGDNCRGCIKGCR